MRKYILPPLVLATLVWFAWYLIQMRPQPQPREIKRESPYVEVVVAEKKSLPANLRTHGVVRPRTLTTLIAEVPGIIEAVAPFTEQDLAPSFRAGGFFRKSDLLVKIEEVDLLSNVAEAEANLRRTQLQLVQEQELAEQAKSEWGDRDWTSLRIGPTNPSNSQSRSRNSCGKSLCCKGQEKSIPCQSTCPI